MGACRGVIGAGDRLATRFPDFHPYVVCRTMGRADALTKIVLANARDTIGARPIHRISSSSDPGLALRIDQDRPAGRTRGLHVMLVSAERVCDVPVIERCGGGHGLAPLHILGVNGAGCIVAHVGPYHCAAGRADARGKILPPAATYLMTEDAANDASRDGAGNIDAGSASVDDLTLDPAALLRRSHHSTHRGHRRFIQRLVLPTPVVISGRRRHVRAYLCRRSKSLRLVSLSLRFRCLYLRRLGLSPRQVGLNARIGCAPLRNERRLLAPDARHVLRRHGTLSCKYGKLMHLVVSAAV